MNITTTPSFIQAKSTPAFGFAKIRKEAQKEVAKTKIFAEGNTYLDPKMFTKSVWGKPTLQKQAEKVLANIKKGYVEGQGDTTLEFNKICESCGCSQNAKDNAQFIKTQILDKDCLASVKNVVKEKEFKEAMVLLVDKNYDNPYLTKNETLDLLDAAKDCFETPQEYMQKYGFISKYAD